MTTFVSPIDAVQFYDRPLRDLVERIHADPAKPIAGDLSYRSFSRTQGLVNGLYAFFDPEPDNCATACRYVGSASSTSFVGRLSYHLDPRDHVYKNAFLTALRRPNGMDGTRIPHIAALDKVMDSAVVFIGFPESLPVQLRDKRQKVLERVETALQALLGARLNKPSMKPKDWDKLRARLDDGKRKLLDVMERG